MELKLFKESTCFIEKLEGFLNENGWVADNKITVNTMPGFLVINLSIYKRHEALDPNYTDLP